MSKTRILFFGTPDITIPTLEILRSDPYEIVGVVTNPDRPSGRGLRVKCTPVKQKAIELGLKIWQPKSLHDPQFLAEITKLKPDVGVVFAFQKLPSSIYQLPKLGTFNIHTSLLPKYRGAAPIQWAIVNGEKETGLTSFLLNEEIDAGDIIAQTPIQITPRMNGGELHNKMMKLAPDLAIKTIELLISGKANPLKQEPETTPTKAPKIHKKDLELDWSKPIVEVYNFIRGMSPFPCSYGEFTLNGKKEKVKIFAAEMLESNTSLEIGEAKIEDGKLKIGVQGGVICPTQLQLPNKKATDIQSYINGKANQT